MLNRIEKGIGRRYGEKGIVIMRLCQRLLRCDSSSSISYCQKRYLLLNTLSVREELHFMIR